MRSLGRGGIGANPPTAHPEHPESPGRGNRTPGHPTTYQK
jgi:syntaxin-binding protein 1